MPSDLSLHMAPPDCNSVGSGKYPGNACNQYYECIKIMWWYNLKTQVCPDSQVFDPTTKHCLDGSCSTTATITTIQPTNEETIVSKTTKTTDQVVLLHLRNRRIFGGRDACFNSTLSTSAITTTATPSPAVAPPDCNSLGSGKYPGNACNQYYECIKIMWWYNLKTQVAQMVNKTTKTIDSGGTATSKEPTYSSAEENTGFTSTLSTSAITTTATPSPADCNSVGSGKYPGESCNEYYDNVVVQPQIKVCPDGQIFDPIKQTCLLSSSLYTLLAP
nr:unnamed protein product [Callosobruchus analis]